ncbi:PEP-utilizing enzyme [Promicromonospora sp. NPDC019610]|uniref:PEP-utilizing enzyme n=1 Tax=Promicromonospora sp. NPDC019610 TaxID=3364405 RepID=UPI00378AE5E4
MRPGDVLVCRFTEPSWTALFGLVSAVVTETGGVLSHAAIVTREHGQPVTVDGGAGRVTG